MDVLEKLPRPFLALAPMDDVTDTVFRQIIATLPYPSVKGRTFHGGPDLYFTEFVNVDGLQSPGREKLLKKLRFSTKERPIFAQLWGINPENFRKTVKEIADGSLVREANRVKGRTFHGFDGVDLNMGCPIKKVIKNGACAALINNRELAAEIIDAAKEAAGKALPVSVKTRVGFTTVDMSWLEFLLSKKLNMLSIHGRMAKQLSNVPADWRLIGQAREMRDVLCPSTLIVGNGDVMSRAQAEELAEKHKLDGVMIGRGVFHDPFVFAKKSPWGRYTKEQKIALLKKHIELFAATWKHGEYKFESLKKFCKVYINGFDGAREFRERLMAAKNVEELLNMV